MRKSVLLCTVMLFVGGLLGGFSHAAEKVIVLEFSSGYPTVDPLSALTGEYAKEMEKKSNGKLKVNFHPGGTMTPPSQAYDAVVRGIVDMADTTLEATAGRFPLSELLSLPLGLKDTVNASRLSEDFFGKFRPKEFEQTKVLFFSNWGPAAIHTRKPVNKLEDLKGMRIRAVGGALVEVVKALGAVPVSLPAIETYDSMRKGVVDGAMAMFSVAKVMKYDEVTPYSTRLARSGSFAVIITVMNKAKWNSLPPDLQKMVEEVSQVYAGKVNKLWDTQQEDAIKVMTSRGHKVIDLPAEEEERWSQRVAPLIDTYVKEKGAKGLPAAEAVQFCKDWVKKNQK